MNSLVVEEKALLVSLDLETHRISPSAILPRAVCVTEAVRTSGAEEPRARLISNGDGDAFFKLFETRLDEAIAGKIELVGQNICGFDLPVIFINFPSLGQKIFKVLELGRVHDTMIREKLLNLADHGQIDDLFLPDGTSRKISYHLESLVAKYLGFDRSAAKDKTAEDRWQLNFDSLDGIPSVKYPRDAAEYAMTDAMDALQVKECQDLEAGRKFKGAIGHDGDPFDVFRTEHLHVGAAFCLTLMTAVGFRVDQGMVALIKGRVQQELTPERAQVLIKAGIISPAVPARPWESGAVGKDGLPKMVPAEPEHVKSGPLKDLVEKVCIENKITVKRTDPSTKFPTGQVSADAEVISNLTRFSPVLAEYEHRQSLQKLVTTELPKLESYKAEKAPEATRIAVQTIHPNFDILKRTGRTSSYASKHYPSINIQQVPRWFELEDGSKIEPRHCYLPRTLGWVLYSADFAFIELVTFAQRCFEIFGTSVLRDKINAGFDPHAYLGAQLAYEIEHDFYDLAKSIMTSKNIKFDRDEIYRTFMLLKQGSVDEKKFFKRYRNFAKPVGLGYPGGLGAETLISFAKSTYGVIIDSVEQAKRFKDIWKEVIPEGAAWLNYVPEKCRDDVNVSRDGSDRDRMAYFSPLGMYRANVDYCGACNGGALQTPTGEGAKIAVWNVTRASYDPSMNSSLLGTHPLGWVHDEFLGEIPDDEWKHERASEVSRLMVEGMKLICPDVNVTAEPTLMRRWDKSAEAVYDANGRLKIWEPKK